MAKSGTCELCGLPDNSYSIEDGGNVFKVCKLCYDGFIAKHGSDSVESGATDDIAELAESVTAAPESASKPETLSPDEMAKLLKPSSEERRKINASLKKVNAANTGTGSSSTAEDEAREERRKLSESLKRTTAMLAADTEDIRRELLETKEQIEEEEREQVKLKAQEPVKQDVRQSQAESEQDKLDREIKAKRAEEKRIAAMEKLRKAANPTIDDERIKITSPEVELPKDTRPKTNFDVATKEHVGAVRFIEAFKYVVHPVVYAVFAGLVVIAVAAALMITMTWKEAVIDFSAGVGAVAIGALLFWYLKRRLETDRRTFLLRIRQEQIAFESMSTSCYRELKTKYPIIKALGWLLSRLSVILPVAVTIGGTVAAVIVSFLVTWWWLAPIVVAATLGSVLVYYIFKFSADYISYKLDLERNQQIMQQTLFDLLAKKGK